MGSDSDQEVQSPKLHSKDELSDPHCPPSGGSSQNALTSFPAYPAYPQSHQPGYLEQLHSSLKREEGGHQPKIGVHDHHQTEISSPPVGEDDMSFFQTMFHDPMNGANHHQNASMFNMIAQNHMNIAAPPFMYQQQYFGWPSVQNQRTENFALEQELESKMQQYTNLLQNLKRQEVQVDNNNPFQEFDQQSSKDPPSSASTSSPCDDDQDENKVSNFLNSPIYQSTNVEGPSDHLNCDNFLQYADDVAQLHNGYFTSSLC